MIIINNFVETGQLLRHLKCTRTHKQTHTRTHVVANTLTLVQAHMNTSTHESTYAVAKAHKRTLPHAHTNTHALAYTHKHTYLRTQTHVYTNTHSCRHALRNTYTNTYTHLRTHAKTHMHTHTFIRCEEKKCCLSYSRAEQQTCYTTCVKIMTRNNILFRNSFSKTFLSFLLAFKSTSLVSHVLRLWIKVWN